MDFGREMAQMLTARHRHEAHFVNRADLAIGLLGRQTFDVLVVDVLFLPEMRDFQRRYQQDRVSPVDGPFLTTCLSVLDAANRSGTTASVIWTEGDDKRVLHMRFAQERLGVRVFADKNHGGDGVTRLHEAIVRARRSESSVDQRLGEEGIREDNRYTASVTDSLFTPPVRAAVWRALALGAEKYLDIKHAIGLSMDTSQLARLVDGMATDADNLNARPNARPRVRDRAKLSFLTTFAREHRYFLLDEYIKQIFD
jgi:hypothetical protein